MRRINDCSKGNGTAAGVKIYQKVIDFCEDFFGFPDLSGFNRIFPVFNFLSQFFLKKINFLFLKCLFFIFIFFYIFLIFLQNSVQKKLSQFLKFPKVNVLGRISGFVRIFPVFNFLSQFFLKKINFLFLKIFIFLFIYFFIFLLNSVQKKLSQFHEIPKVNVLGRISGFVRILISCPNFDLKKLNFLILFFKNFYFLFIFFIFIFGFFC